MAQLPLQPLPAIHPWDGIARLVAVVVDETHLLGQPPLLVAHHSRLHDQPRGRPRLGRGHLRPPAQARLLVVALSPACTCHPALPTATCALPLLLLLLPLPLLQPLLPLLPLLQLPRRTRAGNAPAPTPAPPLAHARAARQAQPRRTRLSAPNPAHACAPAPAAGLAALPAAATPARAHPQRGADGGRQLGHEAALATCRRERGQEQR